jgi:hypothetical protein
LKQRFCMFKRRHGFAAFVLLALLGATVRAQTADGPAEVYVPPAAVRRATPPPCPELPQPDSDPALCAPPSWTSGGELANHVFPPMAIALKVPSGAPLRIALDHRARIAHVGEPVVGRLTQAVYAFDEAVLPVGTIATGRVTSVKKVPAPRATMAYANGNFSPAHAYELTFDELELQDGRKLAIHTTVSAGTAQVVRLVSHAGAENERHDNFVVKAVRDTTREVETTVHSAIQEVTAPGRMERLKQAVVSQSPYRRQYLNAGTHFNASLEVGLDFGTATRTATELAALGTTPEPGSLLHASLVSEVTSATATRGTPVAAILTEPVFSATHQLVLPAYSKLVGEVVSAKPAAKLHHNGDLRVIFQRIETPEGLAQLMQGSLEGVEVSRAANLALDEEGGAHATENKSRYLSTGLAIALAAAASHPDNEHGTTDAAGDPGVRAGAGVSGFGFAGSLISFAARSTPVSMGFAAYGASVSIYSNFLSRGRDVVFPKDTPMEIGFGLPHPQAAPPRP